MKFHLIGIGGAGMSVVADLLLESGADVAGSDREENASTRHLAEAGAQIFIGQDAAHVDPESIVVVSSAIKESNPELAVARSRRQRVLHRSQALALIAQDLDFIAVAGAHGKTSTAGMLATALIELGIDPSYAVGSSLGGRSGGHLGTGRMLVAESDESDGSFLNYSPRIAIVTNIEPDHLDYYGSRDAFEEAFVEFARRITDDGLLIACSDDTGALALARQAHSEGIRVRTYGATDSGLRGHLRVKPVEMAPHATAMLYTHGSEVRIELQIPGEHNILNAAAAFAAGIELGMPPQKMAEALYAFIGTGRRFEERGLAGGVRVVDDYAHHPTEVRATLETAREVTQGRVLVVFQPHLYSRTQNFAKEFAAALSLADDVIVTSVYAAREVPADGVEGDAIVAHLPAARYVSDMHKAAALLAADAEPGDLILTMGAGSITSVGAEILRILEER